MVLVHVSEITVVVGITLGLVVTASPKEVLVATIKDVLAALKGSGPQRSDFIDLLKMLFELFTLGRRNGLIALDDHVETPAESPIMSKYPSFVNNADRVEFLVNNLRPLIDGKIKPDQLEELMTAELDSKGDEADHPVHVLNLVGDSLPGIGIVAAVLGIINTMSAISDGPEAVGERVAAALTGTFLGVFFAYGLVNPLANRVKFNNASDQQYLRCILAAVAGFAKGLAPLTAVEVARRSLESSVQPTAEELETKLKAMPAPGK